MLQELLNYGLSEKEANIYLIALKTGEATANRISELSDYPRSTTYDILEKLKNMGLISTVIVDSKTHFIASSPKTLIILLEEKKAAIKKSIPELEKIHNQIKDKPQAEVFQGKKALIKVFDEIIGHNKEILLIGCKHNAFDKIDYLTENFRVKRVNNKIKIRQVLEDSKASRSVPKDKFTQIRFLDSVKNNKEVTFVVKDYVYHVILQCEISVIKIISKEHSDSSRILFEELWDKGKK